MLFTFHLTSDKIMFSIFKNHNLHYVCQNSNQFYKVICVFLAQLLKY